MTMAKKSNSRKAGSKTNAAPKERGKDGRGVRYTPQERKDLLEKHDALRKSGKSALDAAKAIGVSYLTIVRWQKEAGHPALAALGRRGRPRSGAPAGLTLELPNGYKLVGLSADDLIGVLNAMR